MEQYLPRGSALFHAPDGSLSAPDFIRKLVAIRKAGIVRENYARADQPGVVIVFECDSVATARRYIDDFPLSKAGLLEWELIAVDAPLPLEFLFAPGVDVGEPFDRTLSAEPLRRP